MTSRQKRAARELVEKLERLRDQAKTDLDTLRNDTPVERRNGAYQRDEISFEERLVNYGHSAELARNTLGVEE